MRTYERSSWWWVKEKKRMALVFITITVMMLQFQMKACEGCVETERIGLLELKSYLNSPLSPKDESILKSWSDDDRSSDCCHWERVNCSDAIGGHIVDLSLNENGFSHLFDAIHGYKSFQRLQKLRTLDFYGNSLNNSVLPFLSAARSLKNLNLGGNNLEGVFPPNELANMTKLRVLKLDLNRFSLFSVQGLINLTELEVLDLHGNRINDSEAGDGLRMTNLKTLDLSYNKLSEAAQLKGYTEICRLTYLRELDLSSNALTIMPYCLGNLTRLRTLDLSDNQLNGNLSSFVYGLPSSLEYLSLLDNNFNGSFLFNSLVNQTRLTVFRVSSKVGMIQAETESSWIPLFQLKILKLQNFILGSTIPGFLFHQHDLCYIDLSHNQLTGAFPTWLVQNNTKLEEILLNSNSLTKLQLPRLVHGLQALDISSNWIYEPVQEDIGIVFPKLRYMNFSSNHFHGTVPSSMGEMKRLEILDMSSNNISGKLPKTFLNGCYSLTFLRLSNNQFQGKIFSVSANLTGLRWLCLDGNSFNGSLGKGLLNSKSLYHLDLSDNSISGTLPLWIGRMSRLLQYLYMRGNKLKGHFPRQLLKLQQLQVIDISHNSFSGSIPRNVAFPFIMELRLQSNKFMGSVPGNLFKAELLQVLDLRNNNLSGMILKTIGKTSVLRVLLLRNNNFQTQIPEKICQLSNVGLLDLSHNKFNGVIPSCLRNMSFVDRYGYLFPFYDGLVNYMDAPFLKTWNYTSDLNLDDELEDEGNSQPAPTSIVEFLTKNRYEAYEGYILNYMHGLDLSSNESSGEIPVELGELQNIKSLNLSNNHLTGSIPYSISKLKDLESLDVSNNKLDGNIPPRLADLNSLGFFNVSCNNLSGEIPFKGHLVTFDKKSYVGNTELCGLPTNKSCISTGVQEPSASNQVKEEEESDDDMIDMMWFYWTCGAVYISTSLALFVFLSIDSCWSREWFYRVDLLVHHLQRFKGRFLCNCLIPWVKAHY